jgi:hypothetical protein
MPCKYFPFGFLSVLTFHRQLRLNVDSDVKNMIMAAMQLTSIPSDKSLQEYNDSFPVSVFCGSPPLPTLPEPMTPPILPRSRRTAGHGKLEPSTAPTLGAALDAICAGPRYIKVEDEEVMLENPVIVEGWGALPAVFFFFFFFPSRCDVVPAETLAIPSSPEFRSTPSLSSNSSDVDELEFPSPRISSPPLIYRLQKAKLSTPLPVYIFSCARLCIYIRR